MKKVKVVQRPRAHALHLTKARDIDVGDPGRAEFLIAGSFRLRRQPVKHRSVQAAPVQACRH